MSNLLIIDQTGSGLDLAIRAKAAGHNVRMYTRHNMDGSRCEIGDGLVNKVSEWEPSMNWADLIYLTDNLQYIYKLEDFRDRGYPIFGCNWEGRKWEQDRIVGEKVFNRANIPVLPQESFSKYEEAISYVLENKNKRFVSKPIGDGEKALSYCSKDWRDMVFMLHKWKKMGSYKSEFILQPFVAGSEFAVGGWFGPGGFSKYITESFEHKKLMSGEKGPATGEMGTVMRYVTNSKLFDQVLQPLEGMLLGMNYTGYIDVNCIIEDNGNVWPLEFTTRPGYPLIYLQQSLLKSDPVDWMIDLCDGKDTLKVKEDTVSVGVVLAQPDFPYDNIKPKENTGYPLFDLCEEDGTKDLHYVSVKTGVMPNESGQLKEPCLVTTGNYILVATGLGDTICDAKHQAYSCIKKKVHLINSPMYRDDIGEKVEEMLPKLQKNGFCKGMKY